MKVNKLLSSLLISGLFFAGCGGGGSSGDNSPINQRDAKKLNLTVGKVTLDSLSTLSRVTTNITNQTKEVAKLSTNESSTITIDGGEDAQLFEIVTINSKKTLSFKNIPDATNPTDYNQDGIYEVNIKAQSNEESIIYKAAYKIDIPATAKSILNGKTFYVDTEDNNYTKLTYNDTTISSEDYSNLEPLVGGSPTRAITYDDYSIKFYDEELKADVTCQVNDKPSVTLSCSAQGYAGVVVLNLLDKAPEFVTPASYIVTAGKALINNQEAFYLPKIASFSVTGNTPSKDGKAIISKSKLGGKFSYSVKLEDKFYVKNVYSSLYGGNSIETDYSLMDYSETIDYNCVYNGNGPKGIDYTCEGVNILSNVSENNTTMAMVVCDNKLNSENNLTAHCSYALLPVLFVK